MVNWPIKLINDIISAYGGFRSKFIPASESKFKSIRITFIEIPFFILPNWSIGQLSSLTVISQPMVALEAKSPPNMNVILKPSIIFP